MKKGKEQGDKMDILMTIWTYFATNILQQPAFMIGLIVLIGYVLLGKPWYDTLSGTLKAIVGYLILTVGSGGLTNNFRPVLVGLKDRFQMDAMVIDPYFGQNAVTVGVEEVFGKGFGDAMILLFIAFIVNILLVRFTKQTKLRALFTTGNVQVQQAATAYWLIMFACPFLLENRVAMLIVMALLLGAYWAVGSNLTIKPCQEVTDGAGFCLAHQQMFGVAFFYWLAGKLFGNEGKNKDKKVKRIEDIELPGFMSMFNDNMVSASILMLIFFGAILQLGVRTFVAELTASFQGIADKILPGSVPGVDCAVIFGFGAPNAVTLGFLAGFVGQILAIIVLMAIPQIQYRNDKEGYFLMTEDYEAYKELREKQHAVK